MLLPVCQGELKGSLLPASLEGLPENSRTFPAWGAKKSDRHTLEVESFLPLKREHKNNREDERRRKGRERDRQPETWGGGEKGNRNLRQKKKKTARII